MTEERHVVCLSGGKDSTALAVYLTGKIPNLEYIFCDTGKELQETYDYLYKIEAILGIQITRLQADYGFDYYYEKYSGFLPSPQMRWCTKELKIIPFEKYCGEDTVYSYVGLRADENREGYISHRPNIHPRFPFKENGINKSDVLQILEESGLGLPDYYEWRSRSGCYFCFFQRKAEWIGLKNRHPALFEEAKKYEKSSSHTPSGQDYKWAKNVTLDELEENKDQIKANHEKALARQKENAPNKSLLQVYDNARDMGNEWTEPPCTACEL